MNFTVGGTEYSPRRVLLIAELGTSHGGDLVKARELIAAAAEAGADCVKFQIVYASEILHPRTGEVALPGGNISLYERFRELERDISFYADLKEETEKRGLLFLCTPFGIRSARELRDLRPKFIKTASPELNYLSLLREIRGYGLPVLLSTGVSRLGDIEDAVETLRSGEDALPLCLLHCVTSYPAPEEDYNLRVLANLRGIFGLPVGLSDHSLDPLLVPVLGTALGAAVIEKHFCLSRSGGGLDDPIALTPPAFAAMTEAVREASSLSPEEVISRCEARYGKARTEAILGSGVKRLASAEKANYRLTNRSLHALRDIVRGEIIRPDMFAPLRTEKLLRPGLSPAFEDLITGRTARQDIPAGEGIRFEDI